VAFAQKRNIFLAANLAGARFAAKKMFRFCANAARRGLGFFDRQKFLSKFLSAQPAYSLQSSVFATILVSQRGEDFCFGGIISEANLHFLPSKSM